jgi:hypothetical protein
VNPSRPLPTIAVFPSFLSQSCRNQLRFGAELQPSIQELVQGLLRRVQVAAPVSLAQQLVQMSLSVPQTAVDGLIQIFPLLGFGIAAIVYTYEPGSGAAVYDLTNFRAIEIPQLTRGTRVADEQEPLSCSG